MYIYDKYFVFLVYKQYNVMPCKPQTKRQTPTDFKDIHGCIRL